MKVVIRYNCRSRQGSRGIYGYQYRKGKTRRIVVNLDFHANQMKRSHRGTTNMIAEIIQTIDHEIAHAFSPQDISPRSMRQEETFVKRFERAGRWARKV